MADTQTESDTITFTVYGHAQTAGSKRVFMSNNGRPIVTDDNRRSRSWKEQVASAAAKVFVGELWRCPLAVYFAFYVTRPKGDFGTGRNAGVLKKSAALYPAKRPDLTKLVRCAEDALTGVVWHDDAQIVRQYVSKDFGTQAMLEMTIQKLTERNPPAEA